ncbi:MULTISPECIES: hypothetical protein [Bradyrhizobium]|uniref:Uncharacterized protein n=2 Tax=Bradyrhizobium TaxID=374 RepID=A0ABY0Q868_9BRAD|nr:MULTISPECIES: hypothetical protein [Bradyrhizobium]SDJ67311.1 hypothetical protein SAMN05444163_6115 [Bradyrhizobium ottawaense]SEC27690.1 hypothetical protein SAMN05444171_1044 [Bradyrhizobium lablabi]
MARFVIVTAAALVVGTTSAAATPYSFSDHPSQDGRCIGDNGVGDIDRSESAQIGGTAQRIGPGLQLKFGNGYTKIYLNEDAKCQSDTVDDCVKYQLTGYFPEHNIILIEVDYWEGVSWLLVWANTGDSIAIVAPPHYSPDKRWLASVTSAEGPSGPPNGMDIVPSRRAASLKEWHYRIPDDEKWLYELLAGREILASNFLRHHWEHPNETPRLPSSAGIMSGISRSRYNNRAYDFRCCHFSEVT